MLYLIKCGEWSKVGFTTSKKTLVTRMSTYGTCCPGVELIGIKPGDMKDENRYHKSFDAYESWGEWYKLPAELYDMMVEEFIPYSIDMRPKDKPRWPLKVNKEMVDTYREWLMKLQVTPMTAPEYIKEQMEDNGVLEYLAKEYDEIPELYKFATE